MVEPFLGFIRAHEKQYAREIGVLKVQLLEAKALVESIRNNMEIFMAVTSKLLSDAKIKGILDKIIVAIGDSSWMFDTTTMVYYVKM